MTKEPYYHIDEIPYYVKSDDELKAELEFLRLTNEMYEKWHKNFQEKMKDLLDDGKR